MRKSIVSALAVALIACTEGPPGPQGPVGPAGPQGAQGPTGPEGPSGAGAPRLYSRLMTPRWLEANADFHSARTVSYTDESISFGTAGSGNQFTRLLTVPLLPAGSLDADAAYLVRIVVSQTVVTTDSDPAFGITNGTHFVGLWKGDAGNPELGSALMGTYGNNLGSTSSVSLGGPASAARSFEVLLRIEPVVMGTTRIFVVGRVGTDAGQRLRSTMFDRSAAISFAVFADQAEEQYTFHGIEVSIDRET